MPHSCTKTGIVRTQRLLGPNDQATQEMNAVSSWMTVVVNMTSNIVFVRCRREHQSWRGLARTSSIVQLDGGDVIHWMSSTDLRHLQATSQDIDFVQ